MLLNEKDEKILKEYVEYKNDIHKLAFSFAAMKDYKNLMKAYKIGSGEMNNYL